MAHDAAPRKERQHGEQAPFERIEPFRDARLDHDQLPARLEDALSLGERAANIRGELVGAAPDEMVKEKRGEHSVVAAALLVERQGISPPHGRILGQVRRRPVAQKEVDADDLVYELGVVDEDAAVAHVEQAVDARDLVLDHAADCPVRVELRDPLRIAFVLGEELLVSGDALRILAHVGGTLMTERAQLLAFAVGLLVLFTALGSGPVLLFARPFPGRLALAPVAGFALSAALLTTTALVVPVEIATWALLVPLAAGSAAWAAWRLRSAHLDLAESTPPILLAGVALLLAVAPGLARGTLGPFSLAVFDAWGYIPTSLWLRENTTEDALAAGAKRFDLTSVVGHNFAAGDVRIGADSVNAATSTLFRVGPEATVLPLLAALFALVPVVIWAASRSLGLSRWASSLASIFGLSPALLTMVGDTTLANLGGIVLASGALLLLMIALDNGREWILASLVLAGLVAVYPEFLPPVIVVTGVGVAALLVARRRDPSGTAPSLAWLAGRLSLVALAAVAFAPYAAVRALGYVNSISSDDTWATSLPDRWLTLENVGAWAFGVLHLYQLSRFELLSEVKTAIAVGLPLCLAGLIAFGVARRPSRQTFLVFAPVLVAVGLGLAAQERYANGSCEYCLWKSLTFMLPFLGLGVGLGAQRLVHSPRTPRTAGVVRLAVAGLALAAAVSIAEADRKLVLAVERSEAFVSPRLRGLDESVSRLPQGAHVLIEGADARLVPPFELPAAYFETRALPERKVSFDAVAPAPAYLWLSAPPEAYYSPRYTHVVSAFGGVRSRRRLLARHGPYSLFARAPIDVVVSRTGWSVEPTQDSSAIPWITRPFQLRISSRPAQRASVVLRLTRPAGGGSTVVLRAGGRELPSSRSVDGVSVCAELRLNDGVTVVDAVPVFTLPVSFTPRATESEPVPPPPKVLGVAAIHARRGPCPGGWSRQLLQLGAGWYDPEPAPGETLRRWMGSAATLTIGAPGLNRPATRLRASVGSLAVPRRLTVKLGRRTLAVVTVPGGAARELAVPVPGGRGQARILLRADPPAQSATVVNPGDTRHLAIAFTSLEVAPS